MTNYYHQRLLFAELRNGAARRHRRWVLLGTPWGIERARLLPAGPHRRRERRTGRGGGGFSRRDIGAGLRPSDFAGMLRGPFPGAIWTQFGGARRRKTGISSKKTGSSFCRVRSSSLDGGRRLLSWHDPLVLCSGDSPRGRKAALLGLPGPCGDPAYFPSLGGRRGGPARRLAMENRRDSDEGFSGRFAQFGLLKRKLTERTTVDLPNGEGSPGDMRRGRSDLSRTFYHRDLLPWVAPSVRSPGRRGTSFFFCHRARPKPLWTPGARACRLPGGLFFFFFLGLRRAWVRGPANAR